MRNQNIQAFLTAVLFYAIAFSLIFLLFTNHIQNYIHPRFNWLLIAGCICMIIIGTSFIYAMKIKRHRNNIGELLMMIVVFLIGVFLFPTKQAIVTRVSTESIQVDVKHDLIQKYRESEVITVNDQDYLKWFYDVISNIDMYINKKVVLNAKVIRQDNELLPTRSVMVCCASDIAALGIRVSNVDLTIYENEWVKIEALIKKIYHEKFKIDVPVLKIEKIEKIDKIKNELIYP